MLNDGSGKAEMMEEVKRVSTCAPTAHPLEPFFFRFVKINPAGAGFLNPGEDAVFGYVKQVLPIVCGLRAGRRHTEKILGLTVQEYPGMGYGRLGRFA